MNKNNWTDMDYVEDYIKGKEFTPKTSMENLIVNLILFYDGELQDSDMEFYAVEDKREYPQNLMINIGDLDAYVYDMGGLEEFDYYS